VVDVMASSSSSSSSSRVGHVQPQQLQRASSAPVGPASAAAASVESATASNSAKSSVKLSVTSKALTTSAKRYSLSRRDDDGGNVMIVPSYLETGRCMECGFFCGIV